MVGGRVMTLDVRKVRVSEDDFALLLGAANCRWPEAIISNSGVLLGLAKIAAKRILDTNPES